MPKARQSPTPTKPAFTPVSDHRITANAAGIPAVVARAGSARGLSCARRSDARKRALWENGKVKTTLEIPDDLMRRAKIRAAERNQKLKDTITQLLEAGFASVADDDKSDDPPRPVRLKKHGLLTIDEIESAINAGRT